MDNNAQFVLIAKRILRDLRTLNENVRTGLLAVQEQIGSISNQQEAANQQRQQDEQRPQILNAELQIPEAIQREKRTSDDKHYGVQVVIAVATSLAFIAAAIYAGIAASQLSQVEIATHAAQESAAAANNSARLYGNSLIQEREQFRADQRPYVTLETAGQIGRFTVANSGPHAGHIRLEFHLHNYGKSPAIESLREAIIIVGEDEWRNRRSKDYAERYTRIIPPTDSPSIFAYTEKPMSEIPTNTLIIIFGRIEYTDIFGNPKPAYSTGFCTPVVAPDLAGDTLKACQGENYMK